MVMLLKRAPTECSNIGMESDFKLLRFSDHVDLMPLASPLHDLQRAQPFTDIVKLCILKHIPQESPPEKILSPYY